MAATITTKSGRTIPINTADPTSLLFSEACDHLLQNRAIRFLTKSAGISFLIVVMGLGLLAAPRWFFGLVIGAPAAYFILVALYLCWYGRFIHRNRVFKTLCPHCTSRMWQVCCARCLEPAPPLALWLDGAFLSHCVHCGLQLSSRKKTLHAWCSTCASHFEQPALLYAKPMHIIVWIRNTLPKQIGGGWVVVSRNGNQSMKLYDLYDKNSASLMFMCADYMTKQQPVEWHIIDQTRLLLFSEEVTEINVQRIRGLFGSPRTKPHKLPASRNFV